MLGEVHGNSLDAHYMGLFKSPRYEPGAVHKALNDAKDAGRVLKELLLRSTSPTSEQLLNTRNGTGNGHCSAANGSD